MLLLLLLLFFAKSFVLFLFSIDDDNKDEDLVDFKISIKAKTKGNTIVVDAVIEPVIESKNTGYMQ